MLQNLPDELILDLAQAYLSLKDVKCLSRCCKSLHDSVKPLLWNTLIIREKRASDFLEKLQNDSDIENYTRQVCLIDFGVSPYTMDWEQFDTFPGEAPLPGKLRFEGYPRTIPENLIEILEKLNGKNIGWIAIVNMNGLEKKKSDCLKMFRQARKDLITGHLDKEQPKAHQFRTLSSPRTSYESLKKQIGGLRLSLDICNIPTGIDENSFVGNICRALPEVKIVELYRCNFVLSPVSFPEYDKPLELLHVFETEIQRHSFHYTKRLWYESYHPKLIFRAEPELPKFDPSELKSWSMGWPNLEFLHLTIPFQGISNRRLFELRLGVWLIGVNIEIYDAYLIEPGVMSDLFNQLLLSRQGQETPTFPLGNI